MRIISKLHTEKKEKYKKRKKLVGLARERVRKRDRQKDSLKKAENQPDRQIDNGTT